LELALLLLTAALDGDGEEMLPPDFRGAGTDLVEVHPGGGSQVFTSQFNLV
jgi:hypothetical protein